MYYDQGNVRVVDLTDAYLVQWKGTPEEDVEAMIAANLAKDLSAAGLGDGYDLVSIVPPTRAQVSESGEDAGLARPKAILVKKKRI